MPFSPHRLAETQTRDGNLLFFSRVLHKKATSTIHISTELDNPNNMYPFLYIIGFNILGRGLSCN